MELISPEITVLSEYGIFSASIKPIGSGLINRTWLVIENQKNYILQRVNPMFNEEIHEDIDNVTTFMRNSGSALPCLIRNKSGQLYCRENDFIWRLYHYVDGISFDIVTNPTIAHEAGVLLGEFHRLLNTMDYSFRYERPGVHDTDRHLKNLADALENNKDHARYKNVRKLGADILNQASKLPALPPASVKKVHGDPKINNFMFEKQSLTGICLLDFDTLSEMSIILELGDAMRSWCNPCGEDDPNSTFSVEYFQAGLEGYQQSSVDLLTDIEWTGILPATLTIFVELSARFCADALNEDYFAWDPERYASHSEHSQIRAESQLNTGKSLMAQYKDVENILNQLR